MDNGITSPTSINEIHILDDEVAGLQPDLIDRDAFYEAARIGFQIMKDKYPNNTNITLGATLEEIYNYSESDPVSYTALFSLGIALLFHSRTNLNSISDSTDIYEKLLTYTIEKYNEKIDMMS
tara:strand:- start:565 stop:933 length:369 start_codon:yes stop_codon:yes gene_type:complete